MSSARIKRIRFFATLAVMIVLIGGTIFAIKIAQGYRPSFNNNLSLSGTGLLSATSYPKSAQVYINDRLTTVTDDTLYLSPDQYQVKIVKTGFQPWTKSLPIKTELVTLSDARLFPTIPSLTPLTFYMVEKPTVSPDGSKLAYVLTGSPFNQDNGLYVLSLSNTLLGNQITQITNQTNNDYSKAILTWSPDGSQILAVFEDQGKIITSHLLNAKGMNQPNNIVDTTVRLPQILTQWQDQIIKVNQSLLEKLPDFMVNIASSSAVNVFFSPDHEKMLYIATQNTTLPENEVAKSLPNTNFTPETRNLTAGKTYVYDSREGTNYEIKEAVYTTDKAQPFLTSIPTITPTPTTTAKNKKTVTPVVNPLIAQINLLKGQQEPLSTQNLGWYPTNRHLVISSDQGVSIVEYDDINLTPITPAEIKNGFVVSSPDGNRLVILSNFNQKQDTYNLFSLDLK